MRATEAGVRNERLEAYRFRRRCELADLKLMCPCACMHNVAVRLRCYICVLHLSCVFRVVNLEANSGHVDVILTL